MAQLFIGTSGWSYNDWIDRFYPAEVPRNRWLEYYHHHFATVEINNSFYRLPSEATFRKWWESVPDNFIFSVKANRYITHMKKLNDAVESVQLFLTRVRLLDDKLGPLLFQLPPGLKVRLDRLEELFSSRPQDLRYCLEFRHTSWFCKDVYDLLRRYNVALCIADSPRFPMVIQRTADFGYFRLHGSTELYRSRYSSHELRIWAKRIEQMLDEGADVYVYFDNDAEAYAVMNALELASLLSHRAEFCVSTPGVGYPVQESLPFPPV